MIQEYVIFSNQCTVQVAVNPISRILNFALNARLVLSLNSYNDVLKRQKEKDLEIKQLAENQSNEINKLREDMESKFEVLCCITNIFSWE